MREHRAAAAPAPRGRGQAEVGDLPGVAVGDLGQEQDRRRVALVAHPAESPAVRDEPARQVVEEFGVGRRIAADAEVVDRRDDPLAEQPAPDAVDDHAGRQRILRADEPPGQLQPPALLAVHPRCGGHLERGQEPARHHRAELLGLAADADLGVGDGLRLPDPVDGVSPCCGIGQGQQFSPQALELQPVRALLRLAVRAFGQPLFGAANRVPLRLRLRDPARKFFHPFGRRVGQFRTERHEHLRDVVGQPRAAHLVLHAGRVVGAGEDAGEGVIVRRRDGVELVIVAAGAARRQPQDRARDDVDLLVHVVHVEALLEALVDVLHAQRQEAGRRQQPVSLRV